MPLKKMLPMVEPNDVVFGGWDISSMPLDKAMKRAQAILIQYYAFGQGNETCAGNSNSIL